MRRRQVKLVGNCQANALANIYRDFVGGPEGEDVEYVDDLGHDEVSMRAAVKGADRLIVQERDFKHGLSREELGYDVEIFTFPMILAGFLWPFANEPHVHNVPERPVSDGPYPSQMADAFLNRLIRKGVSPEEALEQYLALDIARVAHLDRMKELYLDRQRERDAATGFTIASEIEARFRTEKMFLTAEHPDANLFSLIVAQAFDKIGVSSAYRDAALASMIRTPFPPTELPLHPGVIAHFGLTYADAATRYQYVEEGRITFEDYVLRYMRYESNPALRHALHMAGHQDPAVTLDELDRALAISPESVRGWCTRGDMLDRLGRREEGGEQYRRAVTLAPDNADVLIGLAHSRFHAGDLVEAEAVLRRAEALYPGYGPIQLLLAEVLLAKRDVTGAVAAGRTALRMLPGRPHAFRMLGIALAGSGELEEAERNARHGMEREPTIPDHSNLVAEIVAGRGRRREAIMLLEEARSRGVENDQTYSLLGNFWQNEGVLDRAEEEFARGAELYGAHRPDLKICLEQVRTLRGNAPG